MRLLTCFTTVFFFAIVSACGDGRTDLERLGAAESALESRSFNAAIVELKSLLQEQPSNASARHLLGRTYLSMGDYPSAEKEFVRALSLDVEPSEIYPEYAEALLGSQRYAELHKLSDDGLSQFGASTLVAAQATALWREGDLNVAIELMEPLEDEEELSPFAIVALAHLANLRSEKPDHIEALLNRAIAVQPDYSPAWDMLGDLAILERNWDEAITAFTNAMEKSRDPFWSLFKRALVKYMKTDLHAAEMDLALMREIAPDHTTVNYLTGLIAMSEGENEQAAEALSQVVSMTDAFPLAFQYLAALQLRADNLEIARDAANRFMKHEPESMVAHKLLAAVEYRLGDFDNAVELLEPLVAVVPQDIFAANLLANSYIAEGEVERGLVLLERVAEQNPDSAAAKIRVGAALFAAGRPEEGLAVVEQAQGLAPGNAKAEQALVGAYLRAGHVEAALAKVRSLADTLPEEAFPMNLEGGIHLISGDFDKAKGTFEAAQRKQPGDIASALALANLAMKNEDFQEARLQYEAVLAVDSEHLTALMGLASVEAIEGSERPMLQLLNRAMSAHLDAPEPRIVLARYHLQTGGAMKALDLLSVLPPEIKGSAEVLALRADAELQQKRYSVARDLYLQLLKLQPGNLSALTSLAKAQTQLEEIDQAMASLEKALALKPDYQFARLALTRLYILTGQIDRAEQELSVLIEVAPEHPDVLRLQVSVARKNGDLALQRDALEQLHNFEPSTRYSVELAALLRSNGDSKEAIAVLRELVDTRPADVIALSALGDYLLAAGDDEQSKSVYLEVIQKDPGSIVALNNLAWILKDSDPEQALKFVDRAISGSGGDRRADFLDTKAIVLLNLGKFDLARSNIDTALSVAPSNPSLIYSSARIYVAQGDTEEAIRELRDILVSEDEFKGRDAAAELLQALVK